MAAPVLEFLCPRFFATTQRAPSSLRLASRRPNPIRRTRSIHISRHLLQVPRERHGKAIEPDPTLLDSVPGSSNEPDVGVPDTIVVEEGREPAAVDQKAQATIDIDSKPQQEAEPVAEDDKAYHPLPLAVMTMPPSDMRPVDYPPNGSEDRRPPHLTAPPYVHHFDTYSLVQDLAAGSFTKSQAVSLMKSIRSSLADHLETAKDGLVSKSGVENEAYLFKAACSELRTEVNTQRYATRTRDKSETIRLEHERDVLTQKLSQDLSTLKDDFARLFNDRKMAVREHQKARDLKIQELNFKIAVHMGSEMKPQVESLRWALTLRGVVGLLGSVATILLILRRNSELNEKAHRREKEEEREQARADMAEADRGRKVYKESGSQTDKKDVSLEVLTLG